VRAIRQAGEEIAAQGLVIEQWPQLEREAAELADAAHRATYSEELALAVKALERRKAEVE
jgi:hypothetical protein